MAFYNKKQAVYSTIRVVKGKSSRAAIKTACEAISYQMRYVITTNLVRKKVWPFYIFQ